MMNKNLGVLALAMMMACNGKKDDNGDTDTVGPTSTAGTLRGTAKDSNGTAQHGTVRVVRVKADGTTETASDADVETTSSGSYQINVEAPSAPEANLIVEVTFDDATTGHALVTTDLVAGAYTTVAPIDAETSAEAEIYTSLHVDSTWAAPMSAAVLRAFVSADVGSQWATAAAASRASLGASIGAAVSGWANASNDASASHSAEATAALIVEEGKIDALADVSGVSGDDDTLDAMVTIWTNSSFSWADLSYFAGAAAEAHDSVGTSNDARDVSSANLATLRAQLTTTAIADAWGDAGAGAAPDDAALFATLDGILDGAGSLDLKLDAAWASYVALATTGFVTSLEATAGLAVVDAASIATDAQATLSAGVEGVSNRPDQAGDDVAALLATYRLSVQTDVSASLVASATMTTVQSNAIATILAELHASVVTP